VNTRRERMTIMDTLRLAAVAVVAATLGFGVEALAQQTTTSPPATVTLDIPQLLERLSREGYRDFSDIERKGDKLYTVGASDAQNRKMELTVDGRTAEVLAREADDDD